MREYHAPGLCSRAPVLVLLIPVKRLQPVIWTKGAFLSPQHLQLQDRFLENLLQFQLESLAFRPWGFRSLQIGQEALAAGAFGISSASGILPDGLLFDIPASDAAPPLKQLAECFEPDQTSARPLPGRAGLPRARPERGHLRARRAARDTAPKSSCSGTKTPAFPKSPCRWLARTCACWPRARRWTATPPCGWRACVRTEAGTFQLDPRFVPPLLDFYASDYLVAIARRLVEILTSRSSAIAGTAPPEEPDPGRFHGRRYRQFLAALHRQYGVPRLPPPVRNARRPSRSACTAPCSRWPAR